MAERTPDGGLAAFRKPFRAKRAWISGAQQFQGEVKVKLYSCKRASTGRLQRVLGVRVS